jgi:hypothetical protein
LDRRAGEGLGFSLKHFRKNTIEKNHIGTIGLKCTQKPSLKPTFRPFLFFLCAFYVVQFLRS